MILSTRSKEAIKTALAMTIAYGIALSMAWDRPFWAGLAVAVVSLSSIGQSINNSCQQLDDVLGATTRAAGQLAAGDLGARLEMPAEGRFEVTAYRIPNAVAVLELGIETGDGREAEREIDWRSDRMAAGRDGERFEDVYAGECPL